MNYTALIIGTIGLVSGFTAIMLQIQINRINKAMKGMIKMMSEIIDIQISEMIRGLEKNGK